MAAIAAAIATASTFNGIGLECVPSICGPLTGASPSSFSSIGSRSAGPLASSVLDTTASPSDQTRPSLGSISCGSRISTGNGSFRFLHQLRPNRLCPLVKNGARCRLEGRLLAVRQLSYLDVAPFEFIKRPPVATHYALAA